MGNIPYVVQLAGALAIALLVWGVLASPLLLGLYLLLRLMRRRAVRSPWARVFLALVFSLLAAPVPTPIITVFVPHGLAVLDGGYYGRIDQGPDVFAGMLPWIGVSLLATFLITLAVVWRYVRRVPAPTA